MIIFYQFSINYTKAGYTCRGFIYFLFNQCFEWKKLTDPRNPTSGVNAGISHTAALLYSDSGDSDLSEYTDQPMAVVVFQLACSIYKSWSLDWLNREGNTHIKIHLVPAQRCVYTLFKVR